MGGTFHRKSDPQVDALLALQRWHEERKALRTIALDSQLTEEVKWGKLCYSFGAGKIAMIYGLKQSCALGFLKGALLQDSKGLLHKPGENSQSLRWVKFTCVDQIAQAEPTLRAYIRQAIEAEKAGRKIDFKEKRQQVVPDELLAIFDENPSLKTAFTALTPGRQRGYNLYFSAPKQSKTRVSRIEKSVARILAGKGRADR